MAALLVVPILQVREQELKGDPDWVEHKFHPPWLSQRPSIGSNLRPLWLNRSAEHARARLFVSCDACYNEVMRKLVHAQFDHARELLWALMKPSPSRAVEAQFEATFVLALVEVGEVLLTSQSKVAGGWGLKLFEQADTALNAAAGKNTAGATAHGFSKIDKQLFKMRLEDDQVKYMDANMER